MYIKQLLPLVLAASASAQTLLQALAAQNATLSSLNGLLATQPALVSTLGTLSNITVLAPSNSALTKFLATPAGTAAAENPGLVAAVLTYHVLNGTVPASAITAAPQFVHTLLTNATYANVTGGQVVEAVLNGTQAEFISGALQVSLVTKADIKFTGGVIHIIDTVLTLPTTDVGTATAAGLTDLVAAANETGLVGALESAKDVTIFAPTNAAFAAIANVTSKLTKAQLAGILSYHVVAGTVGYSSLLKNESLTTLAGSSVNITVANGSVFVNSAKVVIPNVLVDNGVVHVIDSVLSPPSNGSSSSSSGSSSSSSGSSSSPSGSSSATAPVATTGAAPRDAQVGVIGMAALLGATLFLNL